MRISCPICDTGFNVAEKQVGQKGLCPKCSTKFIIPSDPDDDIEILAEGEFPEESEEKGKKKSPKSEKLSEKRKKKGDSDKEKRKSRASTRLIDEEDGDDDDEFDTGGAGKIIGMLAIGLIIGLAIGFVLGRMTAGKDDGDGGDTPEKPSTEASGDTTDPFDLNNS